MEIEVKGHSGCMVKILTTGRNKLLIDKSTEDTSYFPRLLLQAKKQQMAGEQEYQHIRIPKIERIVQDDRHVSVMMEYVYSRNFIEYFEAAGFEQINYFIKALQLFVDREIKASPITEVDANIILDKLKSVEKKVKDNPHLHDDKILQLMTESHDKFYSMITQNCISLPVGICHGDLTFSNILFNGNNYYLIDFLDSFIESPLMDIVKIRQDSAYKWSQLMYIHDFDHIRLKLICKKIDQEIDTYYRKYGWYRDYYRIMQLMNFLRILQYAKEKKVIDYLKEVIGGILHEI